MYNVYHGRTLIESFEHIDTARWFFNSNFFLVRYDGCHITLTDQKKVLLSFVPKA